MRNCVCHLSFPLKKFRKVNKCYKLKEIIGINSFNTSNVTTMRGMFNACSELKNIDLSYFKTSNVTDLSIMFQECFELEYVDISNFNIKNVKNIGWMFNNAIN